ncbi:MAG: methyltransferase domain-containing protein [Candidatus Pacebacteria bacterium]|nr:methyltransferase domain-containing protein [Candidatus Paceibacterota bacterium]
MLVRDVTAERLHRRIKKRELFKQFLLNPKQVGTVFPSSPWLVKAMTRAIASGLNPLQIAASPLVLELGAGTGVITQNLLAMGLPPQNLYVVEINPILADELKRLYPTINVIVGDARNLAQILPTELRGSFDFTISSLPLKNFDAEFRSQFIESVFAIMNNNGKVFQYSYFFSNPLKLNDKTVESRAVKQVWLNFPPATVWQYFRAR